MCGCVWRTIQDVKMRKISIAPRSILVFTALVYCDKDLGYCASVLQKSQQFRVRVWGLKGLTEVVPGIRVLKFYGTHRRSGYCDTGVQNSQKFRVRV